MRRQILIYAVLLIVGVAAGALMFGGGHSDEKEGSGSAATADIWTCSMHPQVQQPKPGKCPICAMSLISLSNAGASKDGPRQLRMSQQAVDLAGITTVPVERRFVDAEIRLYGKIDYDETRTRTIAAWFPARIDRLFVDFTGTKVSEGDHLATVYSPELLQAQQELLTAIKFDRNVGTTRDKLRLWGLPDERIEALERGGKTIDRMDIDAPSGGIVVHKNVNQGDYVKTGTPLFRIADLSKVWIQLDAYESDLPWLRYGQSIKFETEAVPGEVFDGTVSFVSPTLDPKTRTVRVRVIADNPGEVLKPDMFVRAVVSATLAGKGKVMSRDLKDKWISPMHPEIIRDGPGVCDICGMKLVKAEDLGYSILDEDAEAPLVVPTSAVLRTGRRSIVYVEVPKREPPLYEGREILVGPRAGGFYIVEAGLMEGEKVVAQGNFKIDSALQILAKSSMMNPQGGGAGGGHQHGDHGKVAAAAAGHAETKVYDVSTAFRTQLASLLPGYLQIQQALASDQLDDAKQAASAFLETLDGVDMKLVEGEAHDAWMAQLAPLRSAGESISTAADVSAARAAFELLSNTLLSMVRSFGVRTEQPLALVHCPMAFDDKGAHWLQTGDEISNPYFGAEMLRCGEITQTLPPASKAAVEEKPEHEQR